MTGSTARGAYWAGVAMAVFVSLFQMWINLAVGIVGNEENPANQGFFGVVATALACTFVARARAPEMARAMLAVAAVQAALALMLATAPANAHSIKPIVVLSSGFVVIWLTSAALFRRSARIAGG
ncbi:hypothetical protein [Sphingomonas soli]|uniref:hypothetical protein n=1 Tax=Sphingomonas soli TaxID=266127 RepID=UPI0008299B46|nr:hypothetical protein [Sphingomonas soli]